MKILPIHTQALMEFGYTEEESRFLYLVATHSGYFTCQQFLKFIQAKPGKRSIAFARKVTEKKHATSKEYLRNGRVYHLFSRNLYEAIGRDNVRFRRQHSTEYIRTRLIAFDFILRNQDYTYLESEEQKLRYFCDQLGIDKKILPAKRYSGAIKDSFTNRYFVDKFPMFYSPAASLPPVMTFSFIDPGFESMDGFKTHLDAYLTLFTKLSQLRFYYVATRDTNFERAKKLFHGTFQRLWNPAAPRGVFDYFRTRRTWDEKNYGKLSEHDILFINQGKERFGNPGIENLYQRWRAGEVSENTVRSESVKFQMPSQVTFISATVSGQAALFERHPHQPINVPVKSSEETSFPGDFTSGITLRGSVPEKSRKFQEDIRMKIVKAVFCLLTITLFGATVLPSARADEWNKKTVVTFSQAVEVPGKILPAGTYTFKLLDSLSDRHIVQIFNADGSQIITTILAINDYRLQPTGQTVMKFNERAGDSPEALRAWFYPGDNFGQEFVYPRVRAIQLAQTTKSVVPAVAADTIDDNAMKTIPIVAVTPEQKEVEVTTVIQTTPPVAAVATPAPVAVAPVAAVAETKELPQTASSMPLIALLGGLSISLALGLKLLLKLAS